MGYKNDLDEGDMWRQNKRDVTSKLAPEFERNWNQEMNRCGWFVKLSRIITFKILKVNFQLSVLYQLFLGVL